MDKHISIKNKEEIKDYYIQLFQTEAPQIDELIETYDMIKDMSPEMATKTATLKTHLYTKIKLFANSNKFFEQLGIPKEEIDLVAGKAIECLEGTRKSSDDQKPKHEYDLDFLYAIIQNDVIDTIVAGREYTEQDLARLMTEVRTNWEDAEFSDEEFKDLLNETLSRTMNQEDVSRGTVDSEIGIDEINFVAREIGRTEDYTRVEYELF